MESESTIRSFYMVLIPFVDEFVNMLRTSDIDPVFHMWILKSLRTLSMFKSRNGEPPKNKEPLFHAFHMLVSEISQIDYLIYFGKEMVTLIIQVFIWNGLTMEAMEKEVEWLLAPHYHEWDWENEWDTPYDVCQYYKNEMKQSYGKCMLLHIFQKYHHVPIPAFQDVQSKDWLDVAIELLEGSVGYQDAITKGLKFDVECMHKLDELRLC